MLSIRRIYFEPVLLVETRLEFLRIISESIENLLLPSNFRY